MRMITLTPKISSVETKNGVALSVSGVAQVLNCSIVLEIWPAQVFEIINAKTCLYSPAEFEIDSCLLFLSYLAFHSCL